MTIAVIPARRGSVGLPGKNTRPLAGKPLIAWSIERAIEADIFDKIVVSSDDPDAIKIAASFGVDMDIRPDRLSGGDILIEDVLHDLISRKFQDWPNKVCLLNPTSPLRSVEDIILTCEKLRGSIQTSLTVTNISPIIMTRANGFSSGTFHAGRTSVLNRQRRAPIMAQNGAVYAVDTRYLMETKKLVGMRCAVHVMPKERSVDIDDIWDFRAAEAYLKELGAC